MWYYGRVVCVLQKYVVLEKSVVWLKSSRATAVRERPCCACTVQVCVQALPSVYIDCAVSMSLGRKRNELTSLRTSMFVRSPDTWLWIATPSPASAVSALASLSRPCLPSTDVFGRGVTAGVVVGGVAAGGWVRMLATGENWVI